MSKRICVDFDDVLCKTARRLIEVAQERFGRSVPFEQIASFDIGEAFGLKHDEVAQVMEVLHEPAELLALPPMDGAVAALGQWTAAGYEVVVVTGRPPTTREASQAWLQRYGVSWASLVFVDKYSRYHADHDPHAYLTLDGLCHEPFCLAVDDAPSMIGFLAERTSIPVVIFDRPWNTHLAERPAADGRAGVTRCRGWEDVMARFGAPS